MQLFPHRDGQWCNENGEHLLGEGLLLLPELSSLLRWPASTNVFGGRPALSDWVVMTMNWKVISLPEDIYPAVNHFSNLAPLYRLTISLNKAKVMFLVAPGKSGKQPKITINGTELKAISNSHCLCSLVSNDRSSALLFRGSLSNHQECSSLSEREVTTCVNKSSLFGGTWQTGFLEIKHLITDKDQSARLPCCPVSSVHVKFSSLPLLPGRTLIPLCRKHQIATLVNLSRSRATNQQLT